MFELKLSCIQIKSKGFYPDDIISIGIINNINNNIPVDIEKKSFQMLSVIYVLFYIAIYFYTFSSIKSKDKI